VATSFAVGLVVLVVGPVGVDFDVVPELVFGT
jgi:hypothetical protein